MKTKRVMSGVLAGLMLLTGTGVLNYAWAAELEQEQPQVDSAIVEQDSSVVNAADMMAAAGQDGQVELGNYNGPLESQDTDPQLWEPQRVSVQRTARNAQEKEYIYLSDIAYEPESWTSYEPITTDKAPNGDTIRLKIEGEVVPFLKGLGAHAKSEVIYSIGEYSQKYTRLSCYMGVDYSQNKKGNGVKFAIYGSQDKQTWTVLRETLPVLASSNAIYLDQDVTGYQYIKLVALDNGANGNDHSVYGDLRLLTKDYDIASEGYGGLKKVAEYDAMLSANTVEENLAQHRDLILRREFVNRVGYHTIQSVVKSQPNVRTALDWLLADSDGLQLFLEAGSLFNGSSGKTLQALGNLYEQAKNDLGDSGDAYVYKKMMLATAVAYCRDIKTYMVNYGGKANSSNPVTKYINMKYLYDNGYFARKEEFKTYPMELVRYVMDAKMDDSEMLWLREYTESKVANLEQRINGYSFVNYVNTGYGDERFYSESYKGIWDAKYDFLRYGVSYGEQNLYRLWMMMEKGGICWGITGMGMNTAEVHGIPAVNTYQPQHEAYLIYTQNENGDGIWTIWNNVFGWGKSYSRWGTTIDTEARLLLGWGCMDYINYNKNNTTYILLAQAALNNYDQYLESMYANFLAGVYPVGSQQHEAALNQCLTELSFNLDGMYGLIKSYAADKNTTSQQWLELAKRVADAYTYYPAVMVDLLSLISNYSSDPLVKVEIETMKNHGLVLASQATDKESLQSGACREIANSLLGNSVELASFSFDGEHANSIVIDDSYAEYEFMVRYSLDGGKTWEKHVVDGQEVPYTPDHIITLTQEQLQRVNAEDDIVVGLVGVESTHTIDIKAGVAIEDSKVYQNDQEDLFVGDTRSMEFSLDNGETWMDYEEGLTSTTRFPGDTTVLLRYKPRGVYLRGPEKSYTFHASTDTQEQTYLQLRHVTLVEYSSQESSGAEHAATSFIDGNANTTWHTKYNVMDSGKFYTVKLDRVYELSKLAYLPGGQNGRIKAGQIFVSMDGEDWTLAHTFDGLANNTQRKEIVLTTPVQALYVKLVATSTYGNTTWEENRYVSGRMLEFYVDATQAYEEAQVTYSTQNPTNQNVTATLELPAGCQAKVTQHVFTDNGSYTFHYIDPYGQEQTLEAQVSWIDRQAPTGELVYSTQEWTNQPVTVTLDQLSEKVEFADGSQGSHTFQDNGSYTFTIRDEAGNETTYTAAVSWIDRTKPQEDQLVSVEEGQEGGSTLTLNIDTNAVEVLGVNGEPLSAPVLTVTENGTYTFQLRLKATGYTFEYAVVVDWIVDTPEEKPEEKPDGGNTGGNTGGDNTGGNTGDGTDGNPGDNTNGGNTDDKPGDNTNGGTGSNPGDSTGGSTGNKPGDNTSGNTGSNSGEKPTGSNTNGNTGGNNTSGNAGGTASTPNGNTNGSTAGKPNSNTSGGAAIQTGNNTGASQGGSQTPAPTSTPAPEATSEPEMKEENDQAEAQPSASVAPEAEQQKPSQSSMTVVLVVVAVLGVAACGTAGVLWVKFRKK